MDEGTAEKLVRLQQLEQEEGALSGCAGLLKDMSYYGYQRDAGHMFI